jgi:hypothetical protein
MPTLTGTLVPEGALVPVHVGLSAAGIQALRTALRPVPAAVAIEALLDTGAEITCLDSALIQALNLPLSGTTLANLPAHGGLTLSALHDAGLTVVHPSGNPHDNLVVQVVSVLDIPLAGLGYQLVIGRDVLVRCRFLYHGPRNRFRLSY